MKAFHVRGTFNIMVSAESREQAIVEALKRSHLRIEAFESPDCNCTIAFYDGFGDDKEAWLLSRDEDCTRVHRGALLT